MFAFTNFSFISIHALREESDLFHLATQVTIGIFLSTLSVRRATFLLIDMLYDYEISIHALREESDSFITLSVSLVLNFYPRSP